MAEVLVQFDSPLADEDGRLHDARVCGALAEDGLWDGWIEFTPRDGGAILRTPRETEQPNLTDLEYWATGLTVTYLEGALRRARDPHLPHLGPRTVTSEPAYDRPAPSTAEEARRSAPTRVAPHAVLNPFVVFAQGEDVLRQELSALDAGHLRNILRAHGLVDEDRMDPQAVSEATLAEMIVAAVRTRVG
jgi:hypothetical protein